MASNDHLPFEKPLEELRARIEELMQNAKDTPDLQMLLEPMQQQYAQIQKQLYENLSPWNTVELARHPKRPQTRDYIDLAFDSFEELHGDRAFGDDLAIVTGLATIGEHRVMLIGQHKGRNVKELHQCHAGCPHPEGYRKALQKMKMAERFGLPVVCLVDTKGAYPGVGAEERGQGIALAENIREMSVLGVPVLCIMIGEGGSGGALAIGVGDRLLMLRHAYYSVISPEGCASILWRDGEKKADAAAAMKLTSRDLKERGFVDEIVDEPLGGAHRNPEQMGQILKETIIRNLDQLCMIPTEALLEKRYAKYRAYGDFIEGASIHDYIPVKAKVPHSLEHEATDNNSGTENAADESASSDTDSQDGEAPAQSGATA